MNYPCGIIEDLLPLYIDDVCNEESKQAVHNHLTECEKCRNCYEAMKSTDDVTGKRKSNSEDNIIANSLKNVKKRINRKIRNVVLCATAAVLIVMYGFSLLFNIPIKNHRQKSQSSASEQLLQHSDCLPCFSDLRKSYQQEPFRPKQ